MTRRFGSAFTVHGLLRDVVLLSLPAAGLLAPPAAAPASAAPPSNDLWGVACPTTMLCKAVGDNGMIRSWNGTTWAPESSGTTGNLEGVACPTTTLCKAVGSGGTIVSWNGTSWSPQKLRYQSIPQERRLPDDHDHVLQGGGG